MNQESPSPPIVDLADVLVVTRAVVRERNVPDATFTARASEGKYSRVHRGVYVNDALVESADGDLERNRWLARLRAHLIRGGSDAVVSHRAAAVLHGLDGIHGFPEDIAVPIGSSFRTRPARRIDIAPSERTVRDSFPVTIVERTIVDLAQCLTPDDLECALESALRGPDPRQPDVWFPERLAVIRSIVARSNRPGVPRLRRILAARADSDRPTGSYAESRMLQALRTAGISPVRQPTVTFRDRRGAVIERFFPDFALFDRGLFLEVDGSVGHASEAQRARDARRDNVLNQIGRVLRFPAGQLLRDPTSAIADVRANLDGLPILGVERVAGRWDVRTNSSESAIEAASRVEF